MRVWTNGLRHVVLDAGTLFVWSGREQRDALEKIADAEGRGVLSGSPSGRCIWTRDPEGRGLVVDLVDDSTKAYPWTVHAFHASDDDRVLAVYESEDALGVGIGKPPIKEGDPWEHTAELPEPKRASWPEGVIWERRADEPWSDETGFVDASRRPGALHLDRSFHGYAVADAATGIVSVMRSGERQFRYALRVPVAEDTLVHAVPTLEGVLVSLCVAGEKSALLHFDTDGNCLGFRQFWGLGPVVLLDSGRALAVAWESYGTGDQLVARVLGLATLGDQQSFELETMAAADEFDVAVDADRRHFVFAASGILRVARLESGVWKLESDNFFEPAEDLQADVPDDEYIPARPIGDAEINFPIIDAAMDAWEFEADAEVEIPLTVRSSGGEGEGVRIWISGEAIEQGLLVPEKIEMDTHSTTFEKTDGDRFMAELPDVELPQGVLYPFDPKPKKDEKERAQELLDQTHLKMRVVGHTEGAGNALLTVEVASTQQAAPIKWMRPLRVEK